MESKDEPVDERPYAGGTVSSPDKRRKSLEGNKFVFTSAQNNTHLHEGFFAALLGFCKHNEAQLVVSRFTYNKTGFRQNLTKDDVEELYYDPRILEFVIDESVEVADKLIFCGELDILPTAVNPLSGFENYTQSSSGIVPHAKVQMRSLPRMKGEDPRFLYTTGTITQRNYIQRKAGQKAEFHHVFAALYVEIDEEGTWFARQLVADEEGVFYDLTTEYGPKGIKSNQKAAAITWGDIHIEKLDPVVAETSWGSKGSILTVLNPEISFIHDVTDFRARNHHNIKDPYHLAEMHFRNGSNVQKDLHSCYTFLQHITRYGNPAIVVESNHDQALKRWLRDGDIRQDPENAEFFHRANLAIHQSIKQNMLRFNIFEWAVNLGKKPLKNVEFLQEDDSFLVKNIEQGMHGHRGPNGSRGSALSFRTVGRKVNIGHTHSAGIFDGVYVAGVSGLLDMDYNKGPSSWSHSHIVTYQNGKRAIITIKNGKWRA